MKRAGSNTGAVGIAGGAALSDVTERVAAFIAERCRIGCAPDAERIEDDEDRAAHATCSSDTAEGSPCAGA